jgi:histidine triad (HIT) family protein
MESKKIVNGFDWVAIYLDNSTVIMKCVFCEIINKKSTADIVFEDDKVLAFLDIKPLFPGHVLLVPKIHCETIWDVPQAMSSVLFNSTRLLSVAVRNATQSDGIFIANNNIVSQSVPHFHIHIVPRNKKDGLKGFFWPRISYSSEHHRHEVRDSIIKSLSEIQ